MRKERLLGFLVCALLFSAYGGNIALGAPELAEPKAQVMIEVSADPLVLLWEPAVRYLWSEFNVVLSEHSGVQVTVKTVELQFLEGTTLVTRVKYEGGTLPANGTLEIACTPIVWDYSDKMNIIVTGEDANGNAVNVSRIPNIIPFSETLSWNHEISDEPTYYITDYDDSYYQATVNAIKDGINEGRNILGNYGPLNVFILGPDAESVEDLVRIFCKNKVNSRYPEDSETQIGLCVSHNEQLISNAANGISGAGLSTARDADTPVKQITFVSPHTRGKNSSERRRTGLHEYTHAYQSAFYLRKWISHFGPGTRLKHSSLEATDPMRPGPRWIQEGSADYLSWYIAGKKGWVGSQSGIQDFTNEMDKRMTQIESFRASHPDFFLSESQDLTLDQIRERAGKETESTLLYKTGSWAVAWIVHQAGYDAFYKDFFQDLPKIGWKSSFKKNIGMSIDEFYTQFDEFMSKSRQEKLAILPSQ